MPQQQHASQAGTALLSVLLLLSVVSALMVALLDEMLLSLNVSQNAQDSLLARYQATAAEALALNELEALLARNSGSLANVGNWNGKPLPVALDRGRMTVTISDYTACFNLNALVSSRAQRAGLTPRQSGLGTWPSAAEPRRTSLTMQRQFIALLEALEFSRGEAQRITAAIVDWLDSDRIAVSLGAEDGSYSAARGGYRTANQLLRSVTELLDIRGITPDIYARLAPSMCAHPSTKPAPINVNLLKVDQAPLLMMLMPRAITRDKARRVLAATPATGWQSVADFWDHPALIGLQPGASVLSQTVVKSQYFKLHVAVALDRGEAQQTALFAVTQTGPIRVARSWQGRL